MTTNCTYNRANQITSITEPTVRTRNFGYDNADRLTSSTSTVSGQNESYTFDDVGNRTSSHLSSVYGYQQGSFNRLTSTQQASYSFDNNGNLTSKTEGTAKWYYSYDRENRLMNAAKFGGLTPRANESINYQYNAFGRRVVRQDKKSGRTEFTHDGMDVIQDRFEKNDGSTSTTNYVNGLGIDDKLKLTSGTTSRYFLTDHLGSTVGMSDTNGNITESASYDSFGRIQSSNLTTRYGYTGREADSTTGLMYYRARQYDPQIGRFTSEDPIGFDGGINSYSYVGNNPNDSIDPLGLQSSSPFNDHILVELERLHRKFHTSTSYYPTTPARGIEFLPDHDLIGPKLKPYIESSIKDMLRNCECQQAYNDVGVNLGDVWQQGIIIGSATLLTDDSYSSSQLLLTDAERNEAKKYVHNDNAFTATGSSYDSRPHIFINYAALANRCFLREVLAHELTHAGGVPGVAPNWFRKNIFRQDDLSYLNTSWSSSKYSNILSACGCP